MAIPLPIQPKRRGGLADPSSGALKERSALVIVSAYSYILVSTKHKGGSASFFRGKRE